MAPRSCVTLPLALLPALALSCLACSPETAVPTGPNPIDGQRAYGHVKAMVEIGPRPSGSAAIYKCRDYIKGELEAIGIPARVDKFTVDLGRPEVPAFSNIEAIIEGTRKDDDRILVIGSHYDTKRTDQAAPPEQPGFRFVGANDGGSSSGLLLELARHYKKHPPAVTLHLVWFDGEESIPWEWAGGERALFGSKRYVQELKSKSASSPLSKVVPVMLLLDMVGAKDLHIVEDSQNSSPELIRLFKRVTKALGKEKQFFQSTMPVADDHEPFAAVGIQTLDLIQFRDEDMQTWWHKPTDDLSMISAESLATVGHVVVTALPLVIEKYYPAAGSQSR